MSDRLPVLHELGQLAQLVAEREATYLRYSRGPAADAHQTSRDYESGLELPGLSVVPLAPPDWWHRPAADWLARQVCKYVRLAGGTGRCGWVLTGRVVGSGPDHEPLVAGAKPLAMLSEHLVEQARQYYHERFEVGRDSLG
jgi:Family of unknown function (DUF6098)